MVLGDALLIGLGCSAAAIPLGQLLTTHECRSSSPLAQINPDTATELPWGHPGQGPCALHTGKSVTRTNQSY